MNGPRAAELLGIAFSAFLAGWSVRELFLEEPAAEEIETEAGS